MSRGDFINGRFIPVEKPDGEFKDLSPGDLNDELMLVRFRHDHIEEACRVAQRAYLPWAKLSLEERKTHLMRLKSVFDSHVEQMAQVIARDSGKPLWDAMSEAKALGSKIDITIQHSLKLVAEERISNALF